MDRTYQQANQANAYAAAQYGSYYGNMEYHLNSHGQINPQVTSHINAMSQAQAQSNSSGSGRHSLPAEFDYRYQNFQVL